MRSNQTEVVTLNSLLPKTHTYRTLKGLMDFDKIVKSVKLPPTESNAGADGYGTNRLVMCLILQFMEDDSDREFDRFIAENLAAKWFCDFSLTEKTPDYTTICKFRNKIGCKQVSNIFAEVKHQLTAKGFMSEVFTFVDSSALTSKLAMWEERDKAIQAGYDKFNNEVLPKFAADKEARIGAKGKNKFWVGFKKHQSVDMQSGMINKVAVTKANVADADGAKHVLPQTGAVPADKGYIGAITEMRRRGLHPMVILRNNMKDKNPDLDRFITKLRAPFEGTFSKQQKRVRYRGVVKNQAAEFLYAIAFNFRRLLVLEG